MAGVTGVYFGLEEAAHVKMRADVLAQLSLARSGKRFASGSGGGKAFTKDNMSIGELRSDLAEITGDLQRLKPKKYGRRFNKINADFSESYTS